MNSNERRRVCQESFESKYLPSSLLKNEQHRDGKEL